MIAVGLKEQGVALWDARELTRLGAPLLDTGGEVKTLDFSPDGETLAVVTADGCSDALGCRLAIAAPWADFAGFPSMVLAVALQPRRSDLATASSDRGMEFWDAETGNSLEDAESVAARAT